MEKVFESFVPDKLLANLPQRISDYLEKEYKPLAMFCQKPSHVVHKQRTWITVVQGTEEYDLHVRIQSKLRPGRIAILKDLKILKEYFDKKHLSRLFKKTKDSEHVSRLFGTVYNFFSKRKEVTVFELEEAMTSLSYYAEVLQTKTLVEETGSQIRT